MSIQRSTIAITFIGAVMLLSGCGFEPLYGTREGSAHTPLLARVQVTAVEGPEIVATIVMGALNHQLLSADSEGHDYDLYVEVDEVASPLAVQIDATVTRYNYRLRAKYVLFDRVNGGEMKGSTEAVSSYNIVNSQYSTLFAERSAREKASNSLAEAIERDILFQLSSDEE